MEVSIQWLNTAGAGRAIGYWPGHFFLPLYTVVSFDALCIVGATFLLQSSYNVATQATLPGPSGPSSDLRCCGGADTMILD